MMSRPTKKGRHQMILSIVCILAMFQAIPAAPTKKKEDDKSVYDKIEEINKNTSNLFEGDIVPNRVVEEAAGNSKRDAKRFRNYLWRTRIVPYTISSEFGPADKTQIRDAMRTFEQHTCLTFKQHTNESNWINFRRLQGCYSYVGRIYWKTGPQDISLGVGCLETPTILHEIMHALGFWHEQSRPDRDSYVEIFWENIHPDQMHNFQKYFHENADLLGTQYDYGTIMHYGKYAFSKNREQTIKAIGSDRNLGEASTLNPSDITALNALYDCANAGKSIWSTWSSYGPCDSTCYKIRQRFCSHDDLRHCPSVNEYGVAQESIKCTDAECYAPVNGHWGRWSAWLSCSKTCGDGTRSRTRECNNPAPRYGGAGCNGKAVSHSTCYLQKCGLGPNDCEFDGNAWCHWSNDQSNTNRFTWKHHYGRTPSGNTGPTSDHTKGTGQYLYVESSSPALTGDKARLVSGEMAAAEKICMSFWYHMWGSYMGSLRLFKVAGGIEYLLWEKSGDQGNRWHEGNVNITSNSAFKVIFEAQRGDAYLSDIAIDDVMFKDCSTPKSILERKCGRKMKALGCFNDRMDHRLFPEMLDNHRDPTHGHPGFTIDWANYTYSLDAILCHCAQRAGQRGYKKFGLTFYAECWSGPSPIVQNRYGPSDRCVNSKYEMCPLRDDAVCCGSDQNHFVYELL